VSPRTITIATGSRVTFINNAGSPRDMTSDSHPEHLDCPEINQVGFLLPGQQRETGNFVQPKVCGFHDHDRPDDVSLQGTITVR
jgi:hypothetical protein